jgi:hypothetical protein
LRVLDFRLLQGSDLDQLRTLMVVHSSSLQSELPLDSWMH